MSHFVDFNLHNLFIIRLENPLPKAIQGIGKQIGLQPSNFVGNPDLTVSFIDRFEDPISHLVMGKAGFTKDDFYIVDGNEKKSYRVLFPFETLGQPCKIICETGITEIPLLDLIINLRMLEKGLIPIHAAAFISNGTGVIVNGWPKGGKTSTLFGFLTHGAQFVSDDWLFVDSDCGIYGLLQTIELSDWQLDQLPDYQSKVGRAQRWVIQAVRFFDKIIKVVLPLFGSKFPPTKFLYKGWKRIDESQRRIHLSPNVLLGPELIPPTGQFDVLLLTLSQDIEDITITPVEVNIAIERLAAALQKEWMQWDEYYLQHLYAFPDRRNALMDTHRLKQRELLDRILADKYVFIVRHPHPVNLEELYQAIKQVLNDIRKTKKTF